MKIKLQQWSFYVQEFNKEISLYIEVIACRMKLFYEQKQRELEEKQGAARRSKIGTGDRAEKIRTYNYPQNRVTDHRIGFSINRLDAIIDGKLDLVIQELINENQKRLLSLESENN